VTSRWQYQVRFDVSDAAVAESLRRGVRDRVLAPLFDILVKHRAAAKCQFDAFAEYVAAAEEHGIESHPLYAWTKTTIEDPAKQEKYLKSFTLYVDEREVYAKETADALEADLQPLATTGLISRIAKYDTNPANNPQSPQPSSERRVG
jgi:transposase-like protein